MTSRSIAEIVNVVVRLSQKINKLEPLYMSHLLSTRQIQILVIDFTVLESSKGKVSVLVMMFLPSPPKQ